MSGPESVAGKGGSSGTPGMGSQAAGGPLQPEESASQLTRSAPAVRDSPPPAVETARVLRLAAGGRREYAVNAPQVQADVLETQACVFESAARIAEGDYRSLKGYLPSWRWGDIPTAVSRASGYTLDDQGRRVADGWDHDGDLVATMQGDMNRLAAERDAARSEAAGLRAAGDELAEAAAAHVAYTSTDSGRERLREELLGHVRAWDVASRSAAGSPTPAEPPAAGRDLTADEHADTEAVVAWWSQSKRQFIVEHPGVGWLAIPSDGGANRAEYPADVIRLVPGVARMDGQPPADGPEYAVIETNRGGGVEYPVAERNTNGPAGWRVGGEFVPDSAVTRVDPVTVTRAAPADDTAAPRSVAELPATLRTVDDVAAVCRAAGLTPSQVAPGRSWESGLAYVESASTGAVTSVVHGADQWSAEVWRDAPSSLLLAAIRAAQGGTR